MTTENFYRRRMGEPFFVFARFNSIHIKPGGMNDLNLPKQTFHLLVMDVESFYLGETCFLRVLSGIISVTAISAGICITRLTANLYVPAYFSFLSFRY